MCKMPVKLPTSSSNFGLSQNDSIPSKTGLSLASENAKKHPAVGSFNQQSATPKRIVSASASQILLDQNTKRTDRHRQYSQIALHTTLLPIPGLIPHSSTIICINVVATTIPRPGHP